MSVRTKICGLRTPVALQAALDGGADYVGLVFFAKSPRNVSLADAAALAGIARGRADIVALVVDADDAALAGIITGLAPDVLQLHGAETPERVAAIKAQFGCQVWKALAVETAQDAARGADFIGIADLVLFDAKPPKGAVLPGGNGHAFDWRALGGVSHPFMLSGGLNPSTVADAIRATRPWGVDVSSGVESAPGIKDPALIRDFLRAVNEATTYR